MFIRHLLFILLAIAATAFGGDANAGQIWTDFNGDGLPDPAAPFPVYPGATVTLDLWIDAQSFAWSNFLAYVEWSPGAVSFVSASYTVSGGQNFLLDRFSDPNALGIGGLGYDDRSGIDRLASITLQINDPAAACVVPIIDVNHPSYIFSILGNGPAYQLFTANPGTCFTTQTGGGACCLPNGICVTENAESCASAGGTYEGDGTTCAATNCPQPPSEACCFFDGTCQFLTPVLCAAQTGTPQGPGSTCETAECPVRTASEACCFDCGCTDRPPAECVAFGGTPMGPGTICQTVQCGDCLTEACCLPDGSCADLTPAECSAAGGQRGFNGSRCSSFGPCPPAVPCCFPDFTCRELSPLACAAAGGESSEGAGSCSTFVCQGPRGACCFADGSCQSARQLFCEGFDGAVFYPGETCAEIECVPNSVEPTTWGRLKGLFR
ncbi:MAG: hypothetical protein ACKVU1_07060 [bacterium]